MKIFSTSDRRSRGSASSQRSKWCAKFRRIAIPLISRRWTSGRAILSASAGRKSGKSQPIDVIARTVDIKKTKKTAEVHPSAVFVDKTARIPLSWPTHFTAWVPGSTLTV